MTHRPFTIGIIAGSGPEAGMDLWAKVVAQTQKQLGDGFRGDIDAPRVVIVSEPQLGLSMDLRQNEADTWVALEQTVRQIAPQVDVFAIACNTLNWFAPRVENLLDSLPDSGEFLSFQSVLEQKLAQTEHSRVGLLAAGPVAALDDFSVYAAMGSTELFETPDDADALHGLIEDVKRLGQSDLSLSPRMAAVVQSLASEIVVLACTELPLIATPMRGKTFIDVTECVAETLAARAINAEGAKI